MVDLEQLRVRLEALLRSVGTDKIEVSDVTPLTGGYSLFTARFTATTPDGSSTYVVRADPPGDAAITHTDRVREWELLQVLTDRGTVPMPAARWADTTGEHLGTPAIILDYIDGPQLLGHLQATDASQHPALALELATAVASIHCAGEAIAPTSFERPGSWDDYIDGFIAGWRQVEATHAERDPFIRWVAAWLDSHRPPPAPLTLVHGEFQTGNVMLDASGAMQIIDWEFAHVGDPRIDLGWAQNVAAFSPPDLIALDPVAFCQRYCEVTGLSDEIVNPLTVGWFAILGGYKALGAMLEGIAAMAAGQNHIITSAYLVSAMPFSHRLWRQGVQGMEAAMAAIEAQVEAAVVITQPSSQRILEVVQQELADNVRPKVTDPHALASLQMVEHILGTLAVRADHEIAWMAQEIDALQAMGEQVVAAQPDATRVVAALDALRLAPAASLHYDDMAARYSLATEILSCALEDVPTDVPLRATVEALLDARLLHEVDIMGEFQLVGRT